MADRKGCCADVWEGMVRYVAMAVVVRETLGDG